MLSPDATDIFQLHLDPDAAPGFKAAQKLALRQLLCLDQFAERREQLHPSQPVQAGKDTVLHIADIAVAKHFIVGIVCPDQGKRIFLIFQNSDRLQHIGKQDLHL